MIGAAQFGCTSGMYHSILCLYIFFFLLLFSPAFLTACSCNASGKATYGFKFVPAWIEPRPPEQSSSCPAGGWSMTYGRTHTGGYNIFREGKKAGQGFKNFADSQAFQSLRTEVDYGLCAGAGTKYFSVDNSNGVQVYGSVHVDQ